MKPFSKLTVVTGIAMSLLSSTLFPLYAQPTDTEVPAPASTSAQTSEAEAAATVERLKQLGAAFEGVGKIGNQAEIKIPEGFIFFPAAGAQEILRNWGNLINGSEQGLIVHNATGWSVVFEFDDIGYVKDEDKDSLDADKLLKTIKKSEPTINEMRKEAGLPAQYTIGFTMPPRYNETTNNLEWAFTFRIEGQQEEALNYNTKLLGREGVMTSTLIVPPDQLQSVLPDYQKLLTGFNFVSGHTYAEYRAGDKLATYGLAGLVLGGAGFAAAKSGILAKFFGVFAKLGKGIVAVIAVIGAAIWKGISKLIGRRDQSHFE